MLCHFTQTRDRPKFGYGYGAEFHTKMHLRPTSGSGHKTWASFGLGCHACFVAEYLQNRHTYTVSE